MAGPLLHSPADVVRWLLTYLAVGTYPTDPVGDWPVYESDEPDQPDDCITVYDTDPILEGKIQLDGEQQLHYGFQVRVRSQDKPTGFRKASAICLALDPMHRVSLLVETSRYRVDGAQRKNGPLYIGREDGTNRYLHTANYVTALRQTA